MPEVKGVYQLAKRAKERIKFPKNQGGVASHSFVDPSPSAEAVISEAPWWRLYKKSCFKSIDCEFVMVPN